eukprot:scaffold32821_cov112-Isochrysis_galbana.AAC.2
MRNTVYSSAMRPVPSLSSAFNRKRCFTPPPSLNTYQASLSPLATLDEEAELFFSDTLHDYLIEYDLAQYTVNRPKQNPITQTERIRQRHTEWPNGILEAGPTQEGHRRNRPVGSQWEP